MRAFAFALLLATPAIAQTPMTAEEFEAFATGKTLDYFSDGQVFGREVYLPGRQVRWAFTAEECKLGHWYPEGEQICFLYDGDPEPKCWRIWPNGDGLAASYATDTPDIPPRYVRETTEPLACAGPNVGV
ncbi:hypothetical protein L2E76_11575 [Planktothrix agardhii 1811]|uniref:hypothetical protein n=1 Tax=Planktothrix agardhii TaxID=1160 RepID=UPI001F23B5F2|nr:hypothetical protein [Planktothrix agardhii]MCF3581157.1 hypothetical protein [Planktothrix agardhii 1811]